MNVTLEIKGADLSKEVSTILSELTPEEKKQMAKDIMLKWLTEPINFERNVKEAEAFRIAKEKLEKSSSSWDNNKAKTDEGVRSSSEFSDQLRGWKSTKEIMIENITLEFVTLYKSLTKELIANDVQLLAVWEKMREYLKKEYPKYVHDSMCIYFASKMDEVSSGVTNALMQSNQAQFGIDQVKRAVGLNS
jgi:hypothetical protein